MNTSQSRPSLSLRLDSLRLRHKGAVNQPLSQMHAAKEKAKGNGNSGGGSRRLRLRSADSMHMQLLKLVTVAAITIIYFCFELPTFFKQTKISAKASQSNPPHGRKEVQVQTDDVNKTALQDTQKLLRQRQSHNIKWRHPILPKKLITVVGPESSGSTFLTATLASAVGADPTKVNSKARTKDGQTDVQHLSLPWGDWCQDNVHVDIVDAFVPWECFRNEHELKVARDGPQTDEEAQLLKQCRQEVFISQHSNSSCGGKCGTGDFDGYAVYPLRFSVNIASQIEWYLQRRVDVTVILSTRDRSISVKGKTKNHCNIEKLRRQEDEVAIELMNEALEKYGAFGSIEKGRVIVSSYEALMSMKEEYLFGLYKQLGINSTYVPSFSDGNKKYVTDVDEAYMTDKNSSTAKYDILVQKPKSETEAKDVNPKGGLILPKTLITVVGLEGSGSTFLSTTLSKAESTDDDNRLQHISLPQGCVSKGNPTTTTVNALVPELDLYPGRFYVNLTSHIQFYLTRGVDVKVVLVLRDKKISQKEKLRNHHCRRIPPEVADDEDDAAMKIMREAYQKYGDERVMIVSYEGLMQFKQPYLFEIYKSLGIESTFVPAFTDGNRKYVAKGTIKTHPPPKHDGPARKYVAKGTVKTHPPPKHDGPALHVKEVHAMDPGNDGSLDLDQ